MDNLTLPTLIVVMLVIAGVVAVVSWLLVGRVTQKALSDVLGKLSEEAVIEREAAAKFAAQAAAETAAKTLKAQNDLLFDEKKKAIDDDLEKTQQDVTALMKQVSTTFGNVDGALKLLASQTDELRKVLFNPRARGAWGERLAEDVLRQLGFVEGINYKKQKKVQDSDGTADSKKSGRPDYEIDFPPDRVLFMDVKFPLENYSAYLSAEDENAGKAAKDAFLSDVRGHVKALAKRDYVDKSKDNALSVVLLFVPNESISAFIHEMDPTLIDDALKVSVVFCAPLALYTYLSVVRQASESFHTQQNVAEIMKRINRFKTNWDEYVKTLEAMGKDLRAFGDKFALVTTGGTRHRMLNKQIEEIEKARLHSGVAEFTEGEIAALEAADRSEGVIEGEVVEGDD